MISIRKDVDDGSFAIQKSNGITKCLSEILEHNVDKKFYIDYEKYKNLILKY